MTWRYRTNSQDDFTESHPQSLVTLFSQIKGFSSTNSIKSLSHGTRQARPRIVVTGRRYNSVQSTISVQKIRSDFGQSKSY